jgi:hypothetical protein
MKSHFPRITQGFIALTVSILAGCASPSIDSSALVPTDAIVRRIHGGTVNISASGAHETNPRWFLLVSNENLREALETSVLRYGIFSRVIQSSDTNYRLDVALLGLKQPWFGASLKVTAEMSWKLTDVHSGRILWQQDTTCPYTAAFGEALQATNRLEIANEGAIRENIKAGIEQMADLSF